MCENAIYSGVSSVMFRELALRCVLMWQNTHLDAEHNSFSLAAAKEFSLLSPEMSAGRRTFTLNSSLEKSATASVSS